MASKLNIVVRLQHWMDSVPGQTFLNYAYSWGAAVVILGALFKLTHLPGGNIMLFLGMGTEAIVFFLAAFDRPFDKKEIGKELASDFESDEEIERAESMRENEFVQATNDVVQTYESSAESEEQFPTASIDQVASQPFVPQPTTPHTTFMATPAAHQNAAPQAVVPAATTTTMPTDVAQSPVAAAISAHFDSPEGEATVEQEADKLATIIRLANDELLRRAQAVLSPDMEAATQDYIAKLQTLNETLSKVDEQSARLTRDSQEMENLNRTLVGINKVYDLHFASISRQVTTIEDINTQTQQLAAKIEEVNAIYSRMMQTLNIMGNPMAGGMSQSAHTTTASTTTSPPQYEETAQ